MVCTRFEDVCVGSLACQGQLWVNFQINIKGDGQECPCHDEPAGLRPASGSETRTYTS